MQYYTLNYGYYYGDTSSTSTVTDSYTVRCRITTGDPKKEEQKKDKYKEPDPVLFDINELEIPEEQNELSR